MNITDYVVSQLATFAWREGKRLSPGSRDAMLGIAQVIRNRVRQGWEGGDWLKLLQKAPNFSASLTEEHDNVSLPDINDGDFRWLIQQVEQLYSGFAPDTTSGASTRDLGASRYDAVHKAAPIDVPKGALFYCDLNKITKPWFMEKIVREKEQHPRTMDCYPITFFA